MGKTQAEIQKAYRERKKLKEGSNYLERESKRVLGYYKPIADVSKKEASERRKKTREYVQRHRQKKKNVENKNGNAQQASQSTNEVQRSEVSSSSCQDSTPFSCPLIVKLPIDPRKRSRTRISRATAVSRRKIKKLEEQNQLLQRKYKKAAKRFERLRQKNAKQLENIPSNNTEQTTASTLTPRKRSLQELHDEGVSPRKIPKVITDKLILANTLTEEIANAYKNSNEQGKDIVVKIISGERLKKYKLKKKLSDATGINRVTLSKKKISTSINLIRKRTRNQKTMETIRQNVNTFLSRDDNSRVLPGKNDKVKVNGVYKQKRILNDSLAYLHFKYNTEASRKISLATFCRMRSKHIALTKYLSRNKCLCQKHQNIALMLKSMKSVGISVPLNPDEFERKVSQCNHVLLI